MTFPKSSHQGNMPVRVLRNNILMSFENIKNDAIKYIEELINAGKLNPAIIYDNRANKLK
ncbi:MAG: hypothetical protein HQK98_04970 [Nitrospirae bacterium]|nr:hypothetical protein [Nitrospirota bacterium]